jgi:TonB system transport protein ExbD (group 1)
MAAKLSGVGSGRYDVNQNANINITPFVDVMLVLLIIFMVAAPLAAVTVQVKLPIAAAAPAPNPPTPVYISIKDNGDIYIQDFPSSVEGLGADLRRQIGSRNPSRERIFVRADQETMYVKFMQVMNALQDAGFYSVALVGEDRNGRQP